MSRVERARRVALAANLEHFDWRLFAGIHKMKGGRPPEQRIIDSLSFHLLCNSFAASVMFAFPFLDIDLHWFSLDNLFLHTRSWLRLLLLDTRFRVWFSLLLPHKRGCQ